MQVIITRAGDDARTTASLVADLGCIPVIAPLVTRLALPVAIPDRHFDGLIITSRASVAMLDRTQLVSLLQVPVFCVGDATADLARRTGFETVFSAAGVSPPYLSIVTVPPSLFGQAIQIGFAAASGAVADPDGGWLIDSVMVIGEL